MQITEGKIYKTRAGGVFGPTARSNSSVWPWSCYLEGVGWFHWTEDGHERAGKESANDLVEELSWEKLLSPVHTEAIKAKPTDSDSMTKHKLLDRAKEATRDRGLNYGASEDNFKRIAEHWNSFLVNKFFQHSDVHVRFSPEDVAIMMALMKLARLEHSPTHLDSWVDVAGYAACGAEIALRPQAEVKGAGAPDNPIKEYGSSRDWKVT